MKRLLVVILASLALAAACGGDKKAAPTATIGQSSATSAPAAATTTPAAATAMPKASVTSPSSSASLDSQKALGSIFSTLFSSGALGDATGVGAAGTASHQDGDPGLREYVLTASEFPAGYRDVQVFSSRVPDGLSTSGTIDVAASGATRGDATADDPKDISILGSVVMKPQDLEALGKSLEAGEGLSDQDLQDAITGSADSFGGLRISETHVLDASGLGDGGFGMSLSIDLFGLADLLGASGASIPKLNMRLYIFARGDYLGGIVHVAFGDGLDAADGDLALAHIIDEKLQSTP